MDLVLHLRAGVHMQALKFRLVRFLCMEKELIESIVLFLRYFFRVPVRSCYAWCGSLVSWAWCAGFRILGFRAGSRTGLLYSIRGNYFFHCCCSLTLRNS